MDFIFDPSLVLYLPLYELDGASFMSKDAYGHLCTVTGAVWQSNGRCFDGLDDEILVDDHPAFDITTALTTLMWVNCFDITVSVRVPFAKCKGAGNSREWAIQKDGGTGKIEAYFGDPNDGTFEGIQITDDTYFADNTWILAGFTFNEGVVQMVANGVVVDSSLDSGTIPSSLYNCAIKPSIGSAYAGYWNGLVGEVWIYNRVLTQQEIQHNYLATKWRYR